MAVAPVLVDNPAVLLAHRARTIRLVLSGQAPVPARWLVPGFVNGVEQVRSHLRPIRSVNTLLASYLREATLVTPVDALGPGADTPLQLAYALRLVELESGSDQVSWTALIRRAAESRFRRRDGERP